MKKPVYFDYAASTPVDDDILSIMLPYFNIEFGNPSSIHLYGQSAEAALEDARASCAKLLNTQSSNIVFTSGGTESDNLALRGIALQRRTSFQADEIIISPVEHHAVLHTAMQLRDEFGFRLTILPVDRYGMVDPDDVRKTITSKSALVSIIYANNEVGTINPVVEIGKICREMQVPFHSDAVQAAAHLPMNLENDLISAISVGGHKMYGPKGIGLLGLKNGTEMLPVQTGGGQENNLRAGTQNVPLIVGFTEAFKKSQVDIQSRSARFTKLRDQLIHGVTNSIPGSQLTGHPDQRLPNHASFVFDGVDGNRLLMILDSMGFACSSGSACKVGNPSPSEVLTAVGLSDEWALGSLRVTLGRDSTLQKIDQLLAVLPEQVEKARK
jgi:cysteine desulfurase